LIISPEGEDLTVANADIVVINTCGFIKDAKRESIDAILSAVDAKKGVI
jgi:SSU ribosomal protein S12P methylthiotransferase (EC 2.-.-.-)